MKPRLTISQKVFHPVLFGLTRGLDELGKMPKNLDYPQNENIRPVNPIREPDICPSADRQFPNSKKKRIKNVYQKDPCQNKPGIFSSDCSGTGHHILEEHLICGYEKNGKKINQLILGLESINGAIRYTGHILLENNPIDAFIISSCPKAANHPFSTNAFMSENLVIWLEPGLICIIQCSEKNEYGLLMAAVYRGLKKQHPVKNHHPGVCRFFS